MKKSRETIEYTDEPLQMGKRVEDFLPRPEDLVFRPKGVKVTITLSEDSVAYFKEQAERLHTPYQRMIRNLIDEYVQHMRRQEPKVKA
ncbi:MAG: CopG family transcriptional regulator [Chloroflexi bacterium]|nr:MAG: CopG family transcriptional regulator [Chloroflexota bacterium]